MSAVVPPKVAIFGSAPLREQQLHHRDVAGERRRMNGVCR
jgi:hypothetical protein